MYTGGLYGWVRISTDKNGAKPAAKQTNAGRLRGCGLHTVCFLKGETSGFPSQTHPFPESLCVTPKWLVLPLIIAPAFVLRCNTGSITSGILTSHLAYCSTSVHPRDFCRFGFCSYRAKVHSHAVLRARTFAVLASVRVQTVIGSLCLQTTACRLRTQNPRKHPTVCRLRGVGLAPQRAAARQSRTIHTPKKHLQNRPSLADCGGTGAKPL